MKTEKEYLEQEVQQLDIIPQGTHVWFIAQVWQNVDCSVNCKYCGGKNTIQGAHGETLPCPSEKSDFVPYITTGQISHFELYIKQYAVINPYSTNRYTIELTYLILLDPIAPSRYGNTRTVWSEEVFLTEEDAVKYLQEKKKEN